MVDWNAICLCHGVYEAGIRAAIRAGARDVDAVGRVCMAGRYCGGCRNTIRKLIRDEMLRTDDGNDDVVDGRRQPGDAS